MAIVFYSTIIERCLSLSPNDPLGVILYHHPVHGMINPSIYSQLRNMFGDIVVGVKDSEGTDQSVSSWKQYGGRIFGGSDKRIAHDLQRGWIDAAIAGTANTLQGLLKTKAIFNRILFGDIDLANAEQDSLNIIVDRMLDGDFVTNVTANRIK